MLQVTDLHTEYRLGKSETSLEAVNDVSFEIEEDEVFGLVGESGCGKSTIAQSITRTLPKNGSVVSGDIRFNGESILDMGQEDFRKVRWENIAIISQSAMNALDPVYTVGEQIREAIRAHRKMPRDEMDERIEELFSIVGIDAERIEDYPHQFSGGMKQRAMIAMALVLEPDLIIADEPTTALDVISQDTILHHLERIQESTGAAMLMITHDMSVVAETCDRVGVMYAGKLVESGQAEQVLNNPVHPYTMGLRNAFPSVRRNIDELISIPGSPPELHDIGEMCRFAPRCPFATDDCWNQTPEFSQHEQNHYAACLRTDEVGVDEMRSWASQRTTWLTETTPHDGIKDIPVRPSQSSGGEPK